ncbi:hypothetical protein JQ633_10375 [Bradyrhizobium tropiciagri]|uniref:hypothetical protein n=1 Tax=Bradyrhizobium tropiciagri TaxID=312253 RepID=UPI001BAA3AC0|nr:hypothetical protein [Bradyrhizobium tropiciagri]MBR0870765.1 hypothetical protein [Bradyrhizobium tropiciagri]
MQPDNIRPAARTPKITFSDDMIYIPIENLRPKAPILRPKRHDSIDGIIAETRLSSQHLDALPALRDVICGFFAASPLAPGGFLCKQATVARVDAHGAATRPPQGWTPG